MANNHKKPSCQQSRLTDGDHTAYISRPVSDFSWRGESDYPEITACAIATSCCISNVPSQWEGQNFDPPQLPHFSTDFNETRNQQRYPGYNPTSKIWSQIPANLTETVTDFRCTISLYCERNSLLFSTFLMVKRLA